MKYDWKDIPAWVTGMITVPSLKTEWTDFPERPLWLGPQEHKCHDNPTFEARP